MVELISVEPTHCNIFEDVISPCLSGLASSSCPEHWIDFSMDASQGYRLVTQWFLGLSAKQNILRLQLAEQNYSSEVKLGKENQLRELSGVFRTLEDLCAAYGVFVESVWSEAYPRQVTALNLHRPPAKSTPVIASDAVTSSSSFSAYVSLDEESDEPVAQADEYRKLILKCPLSPGDILMLTAALRDLHQAYPGRFVTDVRTPCGALWEHNPFVTPLEVQDPDVAVIDCHYPLVHASNQQPYHFIHGYIQFLSDYLALPFAPTAFKGDLYLSDAERSKPFLSSELNPRSLPLWIICAGGKYDYTIKWWHRRRYQEVVHAFKDRICFVQVGESGHYHPPLENVIDMRGKTSLREMVHLMHQADGVVCGVTFLMHLAAAVPLRDGQASRPAVVIAGGRESPHWEAYPTHQFLHTVGLLPCCASGGCWKSRTVSLGDGDPRDGAKHLCMDVVGGMPRCMHLIRSEDVCRRISWALDSCTYTRNQPKTQTKERTHHGSELHPLSSAGKAARPAIERGG